MGAQLLPFLFLGKVRIFDLGLVSRGQSYRCFRSALRPSRCIHAENYSVNNLRNSILELLRLNDFSGRDGVRHRECIFQKTHGRIFFSAPDLLLHMPSIPDPTVYPAV